MATSRFNKFIFKEGAVFLRMKTLAKKLTVKKAESGYELEFLNPTIKGRLTNIPVLWRESFNGVESIDKDAVKLGHVLSEEKDTENKAILVKKESWGSRFVLKTPDQNEAYYYLQPKAKDFAVVVGPIFKSVDGTKIEIDWENLQWGLS